MKLRYRTLWISDAHLGSRSCRAKELARFLKQVRCRRLYLVGDVIDMQRLRQRWYWPDAHNDVVRRLLKIARHAQVIYLPGNHDQAARQWAHLDFGGVRLMRQVVHTTADGRRLLVTHGDEYDLIVNHWPMLASLGGLAYDWLVVLNRYFNAVRERLGFRYWSLSQSIKLRVKTACTFISRFEQMLTQEARRRQLDGVVCGHIHKAEARVDDGVQYFNCGDWVESCTALVEHFDGRMEIISGLAALDELKARRTRQRWLKHPHRLGGELPPALQPAAVG